jgi:flagellum-specific peptidoglycan hydrolase FlgJ
MTPTQIDAWMKTWAPAAQKTLARFDVPASITLAQAKLESADKFGDAGQSQCALQCNNYFGIKASGTEPYVEFPTEEYKNGHPYMEPGAHFEKFSSIEDSFLRHGELLATSPRYREAMEAWKRDRNLEAFAALLQTGGYSTNPNYAATLIREVRVYDLAKYDVPPEPPTAATAQEKAA